MNTFAFAGYPAPFIHAEPEGKKVQHLIWGDYVKLLGGEAGDWVEVRGRRQNGWMRKTDLQEQRLLEVNYVDIGQGDSCFMVLPDGRFMLCDAGQSDNLMRFLSWRFNLRSNVDRVIRIPHAVISHPDQDHYKGFAPLFESTQFVFERVFHNGIVERAGDLPLGARGEVDGVDCLLDVIREHDVLATHLADPEFVGGRAYPKMLGDALQTGRVGRIVGLSTRDRFLPDYEEDKEVSIEVLGPFPEDNEGGSLRWFGDVGKTKNGHSVVLRLRYREVKLLLGGDLNIPAERHLLSKHVGEAGSEGAADDFIERARAVFEVDVAKACHHGSADFTTTFLQAVNPVATVISSGDDEPHAHPRPEALGAFGKYGRGERPLIFSTELARSGTENLKDPEAFKQAVRSLIERRDTLDDPVKRAAVDKQIQKKLDELERSVAVYGMISLRSDGERILLAQKLERPRGNGDEWDFYRLEAIDGRLQYVSKHSG